MNINSFLDIFCNEINQKRNVNNDNKIHNRKYLDVVKEMNYDEFGMVIKHMSHKKMLSNNLLFVNEFVRFSSQDEYEEYIINIDNQDFSEYPIYITQIYNKKIKDINTVFKGYNTLFIAEKIKNDINNNILFLPIVVESHDKRYDNNTIYHQMLFIIDISKSSAFIFDPNGEYSRFSDVNVHSLFYKYLCLLNNDLKFIGCSNEIKYNDCKDNRINIKHNVIGGDNCVVCCIMFMIFYNNNISHNVICNTLSCDNVDNKVTFMKISLYNVIGNFLISKCSL
jgi:hypothetical protein